MFSVPSLFDMDIGRELETIMAKTALFEWNLLRYVIR